MENTLSAISLFPVSNIQYTCDVWHTDFYIHFILYILKVGIFYIHLTIIFTQEEIKRYCSALLHV